MKYQDYGVEDFIKDEFFVEWVKNPNSKSNDFWKKWMAKHPEQVPVILQAQEFINSMRYDDFVELREDEYLDIFEGILRRHKAGRVVTVGNSPVVKRWQRIAATIVLVLASVFGLYYGLHETNPVGQHPPEVVQFIKKNPLGQKLLVSLPDGSKVKLNAGTTLIYNSEFGKSNRKVELRGEAFFDVQKRPDLPFVIRSGELTTKVLGTSFNVRYYEDENKIQVLVVRGEVAVSDDIGSSIVLNPRDMLEYNHADKNIRKTVCEDIASIIGWKDGILNFNNEPFEQVVEKIHKWYGVDVEIEEGLRIEGYYTGEYKNKSLEKVMDGISYASGFNYRFINENKILIYKEP